MLPEVSPSTVFRYFPTKDALVLTDDYDPIMLEQLRAQPAELGVVAAFRAALRETFMDLPGDQLQAAKERHALVMAVPELRAAFADFAVGAMRTVAEVAAERSGRAADDHEVMAVSGALPRRDAGGVRPRRRTRGAARQHGRPAGAPRDRLHDLIGTRAAAWIRSSRGCRRRRHDAPIRWT